MGLEDGVRLTLELRETKGIRLDRCEVYPLSGQLGFRFGLRKTKKDNILILLD